MAAKLEHVNITVVDAKATAAKLCALFDWKVRWEGPSIQGNGYNVHVGTEDDYLAIYSPSHALKPARDELYQLMGGMNHIGLIVDDLDVMEARVKEAGYEVHMHADYEPGRRFYFYGPDGVEFELVSYE